MTSPAKYELGIRDIARHLKTSIEDYFETAGVLLPERRYLVPGDPTATAWDCEQLAIGLVGLGWGWAEDKSNLSPQISKLMGSNTMRHAVISVQLVRCTPTPDNRGNFPTIEAIDLAGEEFMRDVGLLSQAMLLAIENKELTPDGTAKLGTVNPLPAQGGYHGMEATLSITAGRLI